MHEITVELMQSFVDSGRGGNTAGIVFPADHLSGNEKQFIATSVGISEIAFISHSDVAAYKLEFFTPNKQIPHCGHATVAAFCYLHQHGHLPEGWTSKETIDGIRKINIVGNQAFMQQLKPDYRSIQSSGLQTGEVLKSLHLEESHLSQDYTMQVVNTGNAFLIIPLSGKIAIESIEPNQNEILCLSEKLNIVGFYPFIFLEPTAPHQVSARMFAPRYGVSEESATGTAAGPLAGFLYDNTPLKRSRYLVEQGHWMKHPSPSLLQIDLVLQGEDIDEMMVGGSAVMAGKRILTW